MSSTRPENTIQIAVLDSIIYGAARAFDYLGERGQEMVDKVGDGIIEYCFKEGYLQPSNDPHQTVFNLVKFFQENGYVRGVDFAQDSEAATITMHGWRFLGLMKKLRNRNNYLITCPVCLANDSLMRANGLVPLRLSERITVDGDYSVRTKNVPMGSPTAPALVPADLSVIKEDLDSPATIGLPIFQTVEYGLACAFEYLGAQAQLLLDNVGNGVIEYLQDSFQTELTGEPKKSLQTLASFYSARGLADKINVVLTSSEVTIGFENYRYARVLKYLLDEGHMFTSCPFTLAARSILRKAGWTTVGMRWIGLDAGHATLTMALRKVADQEFDEAKIAEMMETT
jgi:hypothetical protein